MVSTLAVMMLSLSTGCTAAPTKAALAPAPQSLYFALELRHEGRLVAKPKLLGEDGKVLRAERRQPGAEFPDYRLAISPKRVGDHYSVSLDVSVPQLGGHSELALLHGEERKIQLGLHAGDLEVSLLLMRVDSPEFRALMNLYERDARAPVRRAI